MPARPTTGKTTCAVALYGPKEGALRAFLVTIQGFLRTRPGTRFRPYHLDQIPGTVIRLNGMPDESGSEVINGCHLAATGSPATVNSPLALETPAS